MKKIFKRFRKGNNKQETATTNVSEQVLREELKAELRKELKEELRQELLEELACKSSTHSKKEAVSRVEKKSIIPFDKPKIVEKKPNLIKTEKIKIEQACSHCQHPLVDMEGNILKNHCRVSAKNEKGLCYLACHCGFVSRFHSLTSTLEPTGVNPKEMNQATRLFQEAGWNPTRRHLTDPNK